jgi:hypothetical protein
MEYSPGISVPSVQAKRSDNRQQDCLCTAAFPIETKRQGLLTTEVFFDDMDAQLKEWIGKGYEVILSGDLNKKLGADVNGFARLRAK